MLLQEQLCQGTFSLKQSPNISQLTERMTEKFGTIKIIQVYSAVTMDAPLDRDRGSPQTNRLQGAT